MSYIKNIELAHDTELYVQCSSNRISLSFDGKVTSTSHWLTTEAAEALIVALREAIKEQQ